MKRLNLDISTVFMVVVLIGIYYALIVMLFGGAR